MSGLYHGGGGGGGGGGGLSKMVISWVNGRGEGLGMGVR